MKKKLYLLILWAALLASCQQLPETRTIQDLPIPIRDLTTVKVVLDAGELTVAGSTGNEIRISRSADCTGTAEGEILSVDCRQSSKEDFINIDLPGSLKLQIESYKANIYLEGQIQSLQIKNTAGNNRLINFLGDASLWAGRGNITVSDSEGSVEIFNEIGKSWLTGFKGPISMATITGEIYFQGMRDMSFPVNLETDHGPITALIPSNSNYQIRVHSAAGEVNCIGGNLRYTDAGCQGSTGQGKGMINIRAVSGKVEIRILP